MILFVDDERRRTDSYVETLRQAGHEVHYEDSVDTAWDFFLNNSGRVELLILDMMMPPGSTFTHEETKGGRLTGSRFYSKVRGVSSECAVIILTNLPDDTLPGAFGEDEKCWCLMKRDFLPFELAERVGSIIGRTMNDESAS